MGAAASSSSSTCNIQLISLLSQAIVKGCKILLNPAAPGVAIPVAPEEEEGNVSGRKVTFSSDVVEATDKTISAPTIDPAEGRRAEIKIARARLLLTSLEASIPPATH